MRIGKIVIGLAGLVVLGALAPGAAVRAQSASVAPVSLDAPNDADESGTSNVRITIKDCRRMVRLAVGADVDYRPGVDVRGNPVVTADADSGSTIPLTDVCEFNITKDLTAYLGGGEDQLAADKASVQTADDVTVSAATSANVSSALSNSQTALTAAQNVGYTQDATANAASATASQTATELVAKSTDMTLNIGIVRSNIKTGAMAFKGKPLTDASEAELAARCREMRKAI